MEDDEDGGALLATGFEAALVGLGWQFNTPLAVYDQDKCIEILVARDGMDLDEAIEFFAFNVTGAWVGASTPVFIRLKENADD